MWLRFTGSLRKVILYAQQEAAKAGENSVSTEHLLLGLLREDSNATLALKEIGCNTRAIRTETERHLARGSGRLGSEMQLAPRAKRVIDLSYDECKRLGASMVDTEHLLLALIREGEGLAGQALAKCGADLEQARKAVKSLTPFDIVWSPPQMFPSDESVWPPPPQIPGGGE